MNPQILLQQLTHGEMYNAQNEAGDTYQVNRPPTKLHLAAARVLQQLAQQNEQLGQAINQLQKELQDAYNEINILRSTAKHTATSSEPAAATEQTTDTGEPT